MYKQMKRKKYQYITYALFLLFVFALHIFLDVSPARAALTQNKYRWYYNADTTDPTAAIAAENTDPAITAATSTPMHLRMNVMATGSPIGIGTQPLQLQYLFNASTSRPWTNVTDPWFDGSLSHRRKITIGSTTAVLTDFPLAVFLYSSSTASNLINNIDYSRTQNSGQDIRFATASGTPLRYEIEKWDETGTSTIWVKIPSIATSTWPANLPRQASSTYIWMYYGNTTTTSAATTTGVWDSNFVGVWHLNETTGATNSDSTLRANNGTPTNGPTQTSGKIDKAESFDGTNDYVDVADTSGLNLDSTDTLTLEGWANINSGSVSYPAIVARQTNGTGEYVLLFGEVNDEKPALYLNVSSWSRKAKAVTALNINQWYHVASTYDGATVTLYVDGVSVNSGSLTGTLIDSGDTVWIGTGNTSFFSGKLDEARISNIGRSGAWIKAEYDSMNNPNFNTYGLEESYATSTVWRFANATSSPIATDNATTTTLLLTGSDYNESYEEASTTPGFLKALAANEDGEFDFYLDPTQATTTNTYLFRLIKATSTAVLETYDSYPTITVGNIPPGVLISSSTPNRATIKATNGVATTDSFTPPNNSLLLALVDSDTNGTLDITTTMSNSGTALTWTAINERDPGDAGALQGHASAWYAQLPVGRALTVTAATNDTSDPRHHSLKVYVVTGHSTTSPIGAMGEGSSATNDITPTIYTSTVDGSLGFGTADDWNALGLPASTDRADADHLPGLISFLSAYKASATTASGTAVTMNFNGAGAGAAEWNWVGFEVLPARKYKQSAYRMFNNADSTDVGTALAAQDTAATLGSAGAAFRLRMLVYASSTLAANQESFKLQFVGKGSGTCASPSGGTPSIYTDVSASTLIAFNNNATPTDGAALTANANDPTNGTDGIVSQVYTESNPFKNTSAVASGRHGKWDFSLIDNSAPIGTAYCFRMVTTTGDASATGVFTTYAVYPQITTAANSTYTQRNFQWFLNANNVQPGTVKSPLNATTTDVDNGNLHRLRMDVVVGSANLSANGQIFDLQYRAASTGCDTTGTWTNVGGATSTDIWIMYDNPGVSDAATLATALLNSSNVLQNYNESTTFINPAAITSGQAAEWDWGIVNNGAVVGTTYCFRIVKTGGTALDTYTNYPKLTVSTVTGGRGGGSSTSAPTPKETISTGGSAAGGGTTTDPVAPSQTPTTGGTGGGGGGDSAYTPAILRSLANLIEGLLSLIKSLKNR